MLSSHSRALCYKNRGDRSERMWDKRPLHEQAHDVKDATKLTINDAKLREFKSFLTSSHEIDDVFR